MTSLAFFGLAGLLAVLVLWHAVPSLLAWGIERRLGGYRHKVNHPDPSLPLCLEDRRSVAVLGGGVAGLTAASTLARRGYAVTLIEKNDYLGGKLGSWPVRLTEERTVWVSHGFHAFFPHYENLNRWLDSFGLRQGFESIGDYVILARDGSEQRFADLNRTPVLNLLSMWKAGAFSLKDALSAPGRDCYGVFLEYDGEKTFERYDQISFGEFARRAKVPPRLLLAFNTFARAFFADAERLSLAELIKSFHFYYLGQNGGLVYEFPPDDYEPALLAPLRDELVRHGAELRLETTVESLVPQTDGFSVDGEHFDRVILATDVLGARGILGQAEGLPPDVRARFEQLRPGQRYAVLRIWIDKEIRSDIPVFVITEKVQVLDSVTVVSRFEATARRDAQAHGEHVLELHCYSLPDALADEHVRECFLKELLDFFPELSGLEVKHEFLQIKQDFTAFHVGRHKARPGTETGVPGLFCAGDWVKLPFNAMLLEASCSSGLVAANHILRMDSLREEAVYSVPPRGLLAGLPEPPARARILSGDTKAPAPQR